MSTKRSAGAASMRKCSKSLLILLCVFSLKAQNIPTNSWRTHVSYSNAKVVTGAEGIVFCGVENGLFVFQDNQLEILSKSDGLSNSQPTALTFDPVTDLLLIGYEGGVVDIMGDETVTTIEELSLLSRPSNKRINDIVINGNLAFVATNFGIGVIDLITLEIREFFSEIGPSGTTLEIFELLADEETIFAATERGVLKGSRQSNLLDFNNWTTLPNTAGVENLLVFENRLLATSLNQLVEIDDSIQAIVNLAFVPTAMSSSANGLYILSRNELVFWDTEEVVAVPVDDLLVAAEDLFLNEQSIWVADRSSGLVQVGTDRSVRILPNGPANDNISKLRFVDQLYAFYSGNPGTTATPDFQGYSTFDGNWANEEIDGFTEVSDIGILDGNRYFSSISSGVFDDSRNELLSNVLGNDSIITAITAAGGQLWFASYGGTNALYQLAENTWTSYSTNTVGTSTPLELTASAAGTLWIINDISQGGGTYTFTTEDNLSIRRSIADGVPSNVVLDVAIDRRDEAWLATDQGPAVFFDASFSPSGTVANLPTFQSSTLFQNESVNAVAIDGGNRKWIGTDQGEATATESADQTRTGQAFIKDDEAKPNVLDIAIGSEDHTTLVAGVQAAELENALVNAGPLMVFAPTNDAFAALPEGTLDNLLKPENKDQLAFILKHHVTPGNYSKEFLKKFKKLGQASNLNVTVEVDGEDVFVGRAKILASVPAGNGIVHVVDKVIIPEEN